MQIEPVGKAVSKWGEGPVFWQDKLYYVDIEGRAVRSVDPDSEVEQEWLLPERVGCLLPCEGGGFIYGGDSGLYRWDPDGKVRECLANPEPDNPDTRFNDGKCAPDGFLFAGTIHMGRKTGAASLYRLTPSGACDRVFPGVTNSNGLAWSLDGKTLYYIDTPRRQVLTFPYANGELGPVGIAFATDAIDGNPDGMTIDQDGHLWIAFCHGGCVCQFEASSGKVLQTIPLPCRETTSAAFGGPDFATLFVTTGLPGKDPEPLAGRLFAIRGLATRGLPADSFADIRQFAP